MYRANDIKNTDFRTRRGSSCFANCLNTLKAAATDDAAAVITDGGLTKSTAAAIIGKKAMATIITKENAKSFSAAADGRQKHVEMAV